jgi:UPF0755 protein
MAFLKKLFVFLLLSALVLAGGVGYWVTQPIFDDGASRDFSIKPGSGARSVARQIESAGVPLNPIMFELLVRASGRANQLKAGSYEIEAGATPQRLLSKILNGEYAYGSLVVIEGWTFRQMREAVDSNPAIAHDSNGLSDAELMRKIDADFPVAEGLFFPDTYLFAKGTSDIEVYQQAHAMMLKKLDQAWQARAADLPYKTAYDALIMASIIEKETGQKSERDLIAAVFVNRLRIGMLLQTDPTVIYGMGERYQGRIRKIDLTTDTPYNTYTRAGLPPSPIALPGMESIQAALNPAKSDVLYFVAKGNGSSHFSRNLDEHNRAVYQYILKK